MDGIGYEKGSEPSDGGEATNGDGATDGGEATNGGVTNDSDATDRGGSGGDALGVDTTIDTLDAFDMEPGVWGEEVVAYAPAVDEEAKNKDAVGLANSLAEFNSGDAGETEVPETGGSCVKEEGVNWWPLIILLDLMALVLIWWFARIKREKMGTMQGR